MHVINNKIIKTAPLFTVDKVNFRIINRKILENLECLLASVY